MFYQFNKQKGLKVSKKDQMADMHDGQQAEWMIDMMTDRQSGQKTSWLYRHNG